jgi:hypothetical protein
MVAASHFHGTFASYLALRRNADFHGGRPPDPCPVIHFAKTDFV